MTGRLRRIDVRVLPAEAPSGRARASSEGASSKRKTALGALVVCGRDEPLLADRLEIAVGDLDAERAREGPSG